MVSPRELIRADNPTIVRPLAVALTLLFAAFSGSHAAGPADSPWDCTGAVEAPAGVSKTWDCRAAETLVGADGAPDGSGAAALSPVPAAPESKTEPDTQPAATQGDEPLPRPDSEVPPPAGEGSGAPSGVAPAATVDPIPAPALPTSVEPPRPPAWPPGEAPESARLALHMPVVVEPSRQDYTGPSPWVLPPLDRASPPAADTPRVDAALGALPAAAPRDDYERLYVGLPWDQCGLRVTGKRPGGRRGLGVGKSAKPAADSRVPVDVAADRADYDRDREVFLLQGGVAIIQGDQRLEADNSSYDRKSGAANVAGNVYLDYPGARLQADTGDYNLQTKQGTFDDVHYRLTGAINVRGSAATADLLPGEISRYHDVVYTTCPPGYPDWSIHARDLELNQAEGMGTARHAQLRLGDLPLLYSPYLRFLIDDRRRSGFLIPEVGSGNNAGMDIILPYYWNIAHNLDATLYPRYMSTRGLMLGAQVRGLTKFGKAEFTGEVLPHDDQDPQAGMRWGKRLTESAVFGSHWSTNIDYSAVSDDKFLTDFGNNLDITSLVNLVQRGSITYAENGYSVSTWVQNFQTIAEGVLLANRPYEQRPHIQLDLTPLHWGPVEFSFQDQYDYFYNPAKVYGNRNVLLSSLRLPLRRSFGYVIPQVRLYATGYELLNEAPRTPAQQTFVIPSLNLDSGLIFDRDTNWFGASVLQTLEPHLYYVLTPYADQSKTPLFDTSLLTFSYASLFRPNRFAGYDRIGDENRLTIGLTSRTLGGTDGREWFRASLGQILYFASRRVQLAGATPEENSSSSVAGELSMNPAAGWLARASFQWDPHLTQNQWEQRVLQLRYAPGDDRVVNLSYRYSLGATVPERYENTDLSFRLPLGPRVSVVGRWLYSLLQSDTVEAFGGIEFGRCCWRVRILERHLKTSATSVGSTSVMLELELAGLGSFGDKIDKLQEQRIYGYDSD